MTAPMSREPKRLEVTLSVATEGQAEELHAAWLVHARRLSESVAKPLCGAPDGPWSARGFDFERVTCRECKSLVLNP
jgi:hypothetical protein